MKNAFLKIVSICLAVCLIGTLAACSKRLSFDKNGIVKFSYHCTDEEKSFEKQLTKEQSAELIEKLNKVTYKEVKETIDFAPAYDSLTIIVGENSLAIFDVNIYFQSDGDGEYSFITVNNQLCKTNSPLKFILDYVEIP